MTGSLDDADIDEIEIDAPGDAGAGIPARAIRQGWGRNWRVQTRADLAEIAWPKADWLGQETRYVSRDPLADPALWPSSQTMTFDGVLDGEADARAVADHRALLYGSLRRWFRIRARLTAAVAARLEIGAVVRLVYPRWGLDSGTLLTVLALDYDLRAGRVTVEGWG